ncbi:unnamed protein product [Phyllotreta striolata]|uniref:RdRp catalytic domain-containing protein n=1 Tax=Phyllotreta striolata TaxID=444603 RepID=A0A9P0GWF2_PHYSR|nr:unnamed protein product [Phyllotreta striolata]
MTETTLCVPVFNGDALRAGNYVRFFTRRATSYPARQSGPSQASDFVGLLEDLESSVAALLPLVRVPVFPVYTGKPGRKRIASTCNALCCAFISVWPSCQFDLTANVANCRAMAGLRDIVSWVLRAYGGNGEAFVAKSLKGLAAWLRFLAGNQLHAKPPPLLRFPFSNEVGEVSPDLLFRGSIANSAKCQKSLLRFSRFARALPAGGGWAVEIALREHRREATSCPPVLPALADRFFEVVQKVTKDKLEGLEDPGFTLSRAVLVWREPAPEGLVHHVCVEQAFGLPAPISVPTWDEAEPEISLPERYMPTHKVICVPDRGAFKVRVITAGPAALQSLAHQVRKVLYRTVLPFLPTRWALVDGGLRKFLNQVALPPGAEQMGLGPWVALSYDMKAATDRFPHYLIESINDAIESNLTAVQRASPNWVAHRSLSGPQKLNYGDEENEDIIISSCGNLMGTAPSWSLLNLFNYSLFRIAWSIWSDRALRRRYPELVSATASRSDKYRTPAVWRKLLQVTRLVIGSEDELKHCFGYPRSLPKFNTLCALCGDDLAAVCPLGVAVVYELLLELANGRASPGKHYIQPFRPGSYMLLAEEFLSIGELQETIKEIESGNFDMDNDIVFLTRKERELGSDGGRTYCSQTFRQRLQQTVCEGNIKKSIFPYFPQQTMSDSELAELAEQEGSKAGNYVRFFTRRATSYPARQSGPSQASDFVGLLEDLESPVAALLPLVRVPVFPVYTGKPGRKRIASTCNALCCAFISVWPSCQFDLTANVANCRAMAGLRDIVSWVLRAYGGNGEAFVAKSLKGLAAWLRFLAGNQLHAKPPPLLRFAFSNEVGEVSPDLLFRGSIANSAKCQKSLLRFSRFARALPAGGGWAVEIALREHRREATSCPPVLPALADRFFEVVQKVTKDKLEGLEDPGFTLSSSACLERTRA